MPVPIIARFTVDGWQEAALPGVEGDWAGGAVLPKTFSGGLTGSSVALFISSGKEEGNRAYVAVERITGTFDDGRQGAFTVHHGGLEADPGSWFGHIVPGSGEGDLQDITGTAAIGHDEQGAYVTFTLAG